MKRAKPKKQFSHTWVFESFGADPTFFQKRMFGGLAAYCRDRLVMVLVENPGEQDYRGKCYGFDIWDGILLPTEKNHHASLMKEFPDLKPHPVLGKWLYLPAAAEDFETTARTLAESIAQDDPRLGVYPAITGA